MTLGTTPPVTDYVEDGVTLPHAIPFQFRVAADIHCSRIAAGVETLLTQGTDFTVAGGGGGTGTVTKMNAGVVGTTFRIKRVTSRAQTTDYTPGDAFPAEVHEAALDHAAAVDQEQDASISDVENRSLRLPAGETAAVLPPAAARKGLILTFDAGTGAPVPGAPPPGTPGLSNNAFATRLAMAAYAPSVGINVGDNFFLSEPGREGWFIVALASNWTAQIAADTTQGVFVQSTADATKVFRRHPGIDTWYNLKHFGAKGDGTIDGGGVVHGTDDTAAIQAAVNTVNTLNGSKTLYFPAPSASFYRADGQLDFAQTTGVTLKSYVNRSEPTNATPSCAVVYTGTATPFLKAGQSWSLTIDGPAFQYSNPAFAGDMLSTDWSGAGRVTYSTRVTNSMFGGRTSAARHARALLNLCGAVEAFVDASTFGWADRQIIGRAADSVLSYSNSVTIGAFNRFSEYGIEAINVYGTTNWTIEESVFELKYNTGGGTAGVGNGISDLWLGGGGSRIHTGLTIKNNGFWDAYLGKWIDIYGAGTLIEGNFAVVNNGGTFLNFNSGFGAKISANRVIGAAGGTFINNSGPVMPNFVDDGSNICDGGITYNANPAGFVPADLAARDLFVRSSTALADNLGNGGFYHARKAVAGSGVFGGGFWGDRNDDVAFRGFGVFSYLDPTMAKDCAAVTVAAAATSPTNPSQIRMLVTQDGAVVVPEAAAASINSPAAGWQALFIDSADHKLKRKDSTGTVTVIA